MERRILVNYRVDPEVLRRLLPTPFRPALIHGQGLAGICLIRLGSMRPRRVPATFGFRSENAAHRVAVEWDGPDGPTAGVYIHRRHTNSRLVAAAGGRFFPGWHRRARFEVAEGGGDYHIGVESLDGAVRVVVDAREADRVMPGSVFATVEEASEFFRCAPVGYAATPRPGEFDGVELGACGWAISPLSLEHVASSLFEDREVFPVGTAEPDSAFLMAGLYTTWMARPNLSLLTQPTAAV